MAAAQFGDETWVAHSVCEFGVGGPGRCATLVNSAASQSILIGRAATLHVLAMGAPPTYPWRKHGALLSNAGARSGVQSAELRISSVAATHAGNYDVVIGSSRGSVQCASETLTVDPTLLGQIDCARGEAFVSGPCGSSYDTPHGVRLDFAT